MNEDRKSSKTAPIIVVILLVLFTGGCGLWGGDNDKASPTDNNNSTPIPGNFLSNNPITIGPANIADMVEKVSPAVVNIETNTVVSNSDVFFNNDFFRDFLGNNGITPRQNVQTGVGTGFLISDDGYILTNQHVIDKATSITVRMANNDTDYSAKVVGQDYELDLAVLKIDGNTKFTTLTLGDSDTIRVGEWVIAIGNPYGLDHTVTVGVVSAKGRPINIEKRVYRNLIQTDAAINPGNSGGPLLNTNGEVIGINTAVNSEAQGIGFAISVNTAREIINELIQTGKVTRPYIGVWLQPMDENFAAQYNLPNTGVIVANVIAGGPAEKAGLKINDVIVSLNDTNINNYEQLQDFLKTRQVGEKVMVKVIRAGK
ncbi:MAG: trypsin-like peptidase domain-containing protein, partial [Syntrophomonas sp.]|nr:trypsin-like peptidase domain-containing protein [Syntrophomonas sp.]